MKPETLITAVSFACFGVLVGWILGSQQTGPAMAPAASSQAAASTAPTSGGGPADSTGDQPAPLDIQRAADLERTAHAQPANVDVRVDLANLYFDAKRFDQAIPWYVAALKLNPKDADVSTDLGVSYYYSNQVDQALAQLDRSLAIDPKHAKTLLNQGVIRAFGKQDLSGAMQSWERVVAVAPDTDEARQAQKFLDTLKSAHPGGAVGGAPGGAGSGGR
jgi:tetratricopeptide (TPR) repeat protein